MRTLMFEMPTTVSFISAPSAMTAQAAGAHLLLLSFPWLASFPHSSRPPAAGAEDPIDFSAKSTETLLSKDDASHRGRYDVMASGYGLSLIVPKCALAILSF